MDNGFGVAARGFHAVGCTLLAGVYIVLHNHTACALQHTRRMGQQGHNPRQHSGAGIAPSLCVWRSFALDFWGLFMCKYFAYSFGFQVA